MDEVDGIPTKPTHTQKTVETKNYDLLIIEPIDLPLGHVIDYHYVSGINVMHFRKTHPHGRDNIFSIQNDGEVLTSKGVQTNSPTYTMSFATNATGNAVLSLYLTSQGNDLTDTPVFSCTIIKKPKK